MTTTTKTRKKKRRHYPPVMELDASVVFQSQPRKPKDPSIRKFSSECWVVGVDTFFLSYTGDWTEKPEFARKFRKPNIADQMVRDTQAANATANPPRHIRLIKVKESFTCIELTPLPGSPSKG